MKRLVFTAVFNGYDRIYPPIRTDHDIDYVIITDDPTVQVQGWKTFIVSGNSFDSPKAANLYYRAMIHRVLPGYDASLYVDGNIRLKNYLSDLFGLLKGSNSAVMLFQHPLRSSVREELKAVIYSGKIKYPEVAQLEFDDYIRDGFLDNIGLGETTIILRDHNHPKLDKAMVLWWDNFRMYLTRDQLSFPYVIWRTGLPVSWLPGSFRDPNPYFALYPHIGASGVNPIYTHVSARSHDSLFYSAILLVWHGQWRLRRAFRKLL